MNSDKSLKDLSAEYRTEAERIKAQIARHKQALKTLPEWSARRIETNRAIAVLADMLRDVTIIADGLEHYYESENSLRGIHIYTEEDK